MVELVGGRSAINRAYLLQFNDKAVCRTTSWLPLGMLVVSNIMGLDLSFALFYYRFVQADKETAIMP